MTQKEVNDIAYKIVGCAIEVHKHLGPGLLESIYHECMVSELREQGLHVASELYVPVVYKGKELKNDLRLDLLVNDTVVVELKAVETMIPVYQAQLLTYLKLAEKPKGLLINFNVENITRYVIPLVTDTFAKLPDA